MCSLFRICKQASAHRKFAYFVALLARLLYRLDWSEFALECQNLLQQLLKNSPSKAGEAVAPIQTQVRQLSLVSLWRSFVHCTVLSTKYPIAIPRNCTSALTLTGNTDRIKTFESFGQNQHFSDCSCKCWFSKASMGLDDGGCLSLTGVVQHCNIGGGRVGVVLVVGVVAIFSVSE